MSWRNCRQSSKVLGRERKLLEELKLNKVPEVPLPGKTINYRKNRKFLDCG
jgi:hypothetical protein